MLWSTATSLLINNTGLPLSTLVSFAAVLIGLTIAWLVIVVYRERMTAHAVDLAQKRIANHGIPAGSTLHDIITEARIYLSNRKTFVQRLFSLKAMHGSLFFVSWFNIAGRIFASNQSGDFTCHTYPVYKPINTKHLQGKSANLTFVPARDPDYARLPWASGITNWSLLVIGGSFLFAAVVGVVWSFVAGRRAKNVEVENDLYMNAVDADEDKLSSSA